MNALAGINQHHGVTAGAAGKLLHETLDTFLVTQRLQVSQHCLPRLIRRHAGPPAKALAVWPIPDSAKLRFIINTVTGAAQGSGGSFTRGNL